MYLGGNVGSSHPGFSAMYGSTNNWTITGSGLADTLNLNLPRDPGTVFGTVIGGLFTISLGDGDDTINSAKLVNGDSVNMGAGDDTVSPMFGTNAGGNQTFGNANLTLLDGGAGEDTLSFGESTNEDGVTLSLSTANATNFENIIGTNNAETINGDANSNKLYGSLNGSSDVNTLNGNDGNDFLLVSNSSDGGTDRSWLVTPASGSDLSSSLNFLTKFAGSGNQTLNGGAGDDVLIGGTGEDTLDGGTGRDHLAGGSGIDTFIIRAGDGASSIDDADIVYDFTDGNDLIGMSGLEYSQLTIEQGTGDYANHVVVKKTDTGEYLVIIQNTSLSSISNADFSAI
jgi:Ca2+-binding RTX toxin-like protein